MTKKIMVLDGRKHGKSLAIAEAAAIQEAIRELAKAAVSHAVSNMIKEMREATVPSLSEFKERLDRSTLSADELNEVLRRHKVEIEQEADNTPAIHRNRPKQPNPKRFRK